MHSSPTTPMHQVGPPPASWPVLQGWTVFALLIYIYIFVNIYEQPKDSPTLNMLVLVQQYYVFSVTFGEVLSAI